MKWLGLLALVAGALSIAALALAFGASRDPVPGALKDCVREGGGTLVRGPEGLQPVRADLLARDLPVTRRLRLAPETEAVLLGGTRARVLVVAGPSSPRLDGADFLDRLYADPSRFSVVAAETDPRRGLLLRCAQRAGR